MIAIKAEERRRHRVQEHTRACEPWDTLELEEVGAWATEIEATHVP
jgi:hypothetical protein